MSTTAFLVTSQTGTLPSLQRTALLGRRTLWLPASVQPRLWSALQLAATVQMLEREASEGLDYIQSWRTTCNKDHYIQT
jgi:hypothetical protein